MQVQKVNYQTLNKNNNKQYNYQQKFGFNPSPGFKEPSKLLEVVMNIKKFLIGEKEINLKSEIRRRFFLNGDLKRKTEINRISPEIIVTKWDRKRKIMSQITTIKRLGQSTERIMFRRMPHDEGFFSVHTINGRIIEAQTHPDLKL